jgi:hypothetical protein
LGPLTMVILHRHEEWRISSWEGDQFAELPLEGEIRDLPSSLEWQRWDGGVSDLKFQLRPSFPLSRNQTRPSPSHPVGTPSFTSAFLPASKCTGSAMAPSASSRASPPKVSAIPGTATARRARFVTHCARARAALSIRPIGRSTTLWLPSI